MKPVPSATLDVKRMFAYLVLGSFFLICVVPVWLMLVNATRSTEEIQQGLSLLPSVHLFDNWKVLTGRGFSIGSGFANSVIVSVGVTVLSVYFSTLAAYGLAMFDFRGNKGLLKFIIMIMAIPPQLGMIGFYKYMADLHMLDNLLPLILPAIATPATVFFMRQYVKSVIHKDLVDAARIDGCGEFSTFNRIILPILGPGLATMAIFAFVGSWNAFIMPYILISDRNLYTLPMLVQQLRTDIYRTEYGGIYLGISVTIVPILAFYAFMSKYIIAGVTVGSIKE